MASFTYPKSNTVEQLDDYHGTKVNDPYRWLEDPNAADTRAWVEAQNRLTFSFLEDIPERARIGARLTELWNFPKRLAPFKKGGRTFEFRNSGLQNQNVLYVMDAPQDEGRVLLDPNTLSEDGTVALGGLSVSKDGRYLAYAVSESGSDWQRWHVREVASGEDLEDVLKWSKFSGATWLPDSSGFYYSRYPAPQEGEAYVSANENPQLLFHRLGTPQGDDEVVYERPDEPKWMFHPTVSDDERYLLMTISRSTEPRNLLYYKDLQTDVQAGGEFVPLIAEFEASYGFVGNDGPVFYIDTTADAERGRLIAIDLRNPERSAWRTLIAETDDVLEGAVMLQDQFVVFYLHHAHHQLKRFDSQGALQGEIALPTLGSLAELHAERGDREMFYSFTSFLYPTRSYRYDLGRGTSEPLFTPEVAFDPEPFETRQVFAVSPDGTRVPMFLTHKKDLVYDGQNPTLLYGYGGFNIALTPSFSVSRLVWLEQGGVLAVANLRGGGEYGRAWHEAGIKVHKQNVFDDFIACAEYLVQERVTTPQKLAIQGGSNGGLLVGACMTQHPELFGAALPAVGVLDMLRFHKFTIGWAWVSDYGSADDPEEFAALYTYSPLHALKPGTRYPATLITTGDFDDRVVPAHSFKFAAALQAAHAGDAPMLIRIQTKAGHGMGKPTKMLIEEQADIWAFLRRALEIS